MGHTTLHNRLHELAADIGRLRRCTPEGSLLEWRTERLADHVQDCIAILQPSAAEIAATHAPGDETAITEAIRLVDERTRRLRHQLGWPNGC